MSETGEPRAVIVISSHVARGSVGNRAAVFALETLGYPVWAVPTVILPWHPGHGPATRIVPDAKQFSAFIRNLETAPWLGEVAGVLSGYLGDATQAASVACLVAAVRARNPNATYICDPVMGDVGGLYVPEALATALRDELIPMADIATPNRYELEWLSGGARLDDISSVVRAASQVGPEKMLITSAPAMLAGSTGNLLVTPSATLLAEHRIIERPPNGLGDLTAAVFLARLLGGQPLDKALQSTTASVFEILARTAKRGGDELQLETDAQSLSHPMAMVHLRRLAHTGKDRSA
ncbi:MAG: pyridoxal kinase PdxY [Pseudaminobacter sp.]